MVDPTNGTASNERAQDFPQPQLTREQLWKINLSNVVQKDSRQRWNKASPLRVNAYNERNNRNHAVIHIEQGQTVKEDRMCSQFLISH